MKSIQNGRINLATEAFGNPEDPAIVLVMGATASRLGWPMGLCRALERQGLYVIRFDHRDTGLSTTAPPGQADYVVEDLATDVMAVLDGYGLPRAHLAGMSLGGYIAQMLALDHPDRIASLSLMASEPLGWDGAPLPHISEPVMAHFGGLGALDWQDRSAVAAFLLELQRLCAGTSSRFDAAAELAVIDQMLSETESPASMFNHASITVRRDWMGAFRKIDCPVLVLHGDCDPVLPIANGRALATGIARARLMTLPDTGHGLPSSMHDTIAHAIAAQVRAIP